MQPRFGFLIRLRLGLCHSFGEHCEGLFSTKFQQDDWLSLFIGLLFVFFKRNSDLTKAAKPTFSFFLASDVDIALCVL